MRLIDADMILKEQWPMVMYDDTGCSETVRAVMVKDIENAQTVQADPVRRWHFVGEDSEELPENGQWCAVMYMSPISRFPRGTVARWYDGNIVTAWHDWFLELMPEACFYEPIVNGGVAKVASVGMKCVIAWMPIEMDERIYGESNE